MVRLWISAGYTTMNTNGLYHQSGKAGQGLAAVDTLIDGVARPV
jgi:hypothetical protein